jgi:hypothetical protein
LRQFVCKNGAGPAKPDDDSVFVGKPARHCLFSLQSMQISVVCNDSRATIVTSLDDWQC